MRITLSENFRAVLYAPFYATVALGFAKREGVDVAFVTQPAPAAATAGLLDGSIDVSWGGPMRVLKARDEPGGLPIVCFCEVVRRDPFYLVARRGIDRFELRDLARLRFASVSEVPTPWLCLQHDLRKIGLDPGGLDRLADRSMAVNIEALGKGELDVAQVFEPFAAMAERQGVGRVVHAAAARGDTAYTTLLATREGVARKRDALAALVRAVASMQQWLAVHSADELAEAVTPYFGHVDAADLRTALSRYKAANLWATDTNVSRAGFARLAASLVSGGFISRAAAYEDCVADVTGSSPANPS